jgi:lipopolysaccharide/colanic/teichoic acid biosynthesis glycosyltransferase
VLVQASPLLIPAPRRALRPGRAGFRPWDYEISKRLLDVALTVITLLVLLPVLVACALAVRLSSPGPVLFQQMRTGRDGTRFMILKFRTMVANAEQLKGSVAHLNVLPFPDFKIPDDPRITRVGRFLRKTSLDELPQLVNVLRGDMSLVGPRPTSFDPSVYYLWHTKRLEVRPGITGLWQIRGRNTTTFDERLRLDLAYINRMSLIYDLRILLSTVPAVFRRAGA